MKNSPQNALMKAPPLSLVSLRNGVLIVRLPVSLLPFFLAGLGAGWVS